MKIRRVFWIHHLVVKKKTIAKQTDFDRGKSRAECMEEIYSKYVRPSDVNYQTDNFAEVISSRIMEQEHEVDSIVPSVKHFGTDCLFAPSVYADIQTHPERMKISKKAKLGEEII